MIATWKTPQNRKNVDVTIMITIFWSYIYLFLKKHHLWIFKHTLVTKFFKENLNNGNYNKNIIFANYLVQKIKFKIFN
jgi:hypothetical protein